MAERVLITGATGFLGSALERRARQEGALCLGIGRARRERADYHAVDLLEGHGELARLLAELRPDRVYHLAGGAAGDPFSLNVGTTRNLLQALRAVPDLRPRVLMAGSAAEYGDLGPEPISENARELPVSEYGIAKLAQTRLALLARRAGMRVTVVRPFNIIGPGMSMSLAPARFAREVLRAIAFGRNHVTVGDLSTVRDYLEVGDVGRAMWLLGGRDFDDPIVNVCSGLPVSTGEVLSEVMRQVGASLEVRTDPGLIRGPGDVPVSVGSQERLRSLTGEVYTFSLPEAIAGLLRAVRAAPAS